MSHGGTRKGAGRKPRDVSRVAVTVRLEPEVYAQFQKLREASNMSESAQFSKIVKRAKL